jgi:pimeloyl-ACP methyl ester carboxylesterase
MLRLAVAAAVAAAMGLPQAASARAHPRLRARPDLVVAGGSVRLTGGALKGSFVVENVGSRSAAPSSAALSIRVGKRLRTLGSFRVPRLARFGTQVIRVAIRLPGNLAAGSYPMQACANASRSVTELSTRNDCRALGKLVVSHRTTGGPNPNPTPNPTPSPNPAPTPNPPVSTVPTNPVPFSKDTVLTFTDPQSNYWVFVPDPYDSTHQTPTELFVWMHGCGGEGAGDIYTISPSTSESYISLSVGGREDDCWDPNVDQDKVLAAIADVETHFNIDRHRIVIGGYSSGGDLAYRTAFYHANLFAGLLAENTSPFRDTGSTQAASLAAASWTFHVVHLAHIEDATYPIAGVRQETDAMAAAGFPIQRIERPGAHYDANTDSDMQTLLLPHLNDGWQSP